MQSGKGKVDNWVLELAPEVRRSRRSADGLDLLRQHGAAGAPGVRQSGPRRIAYAERNGIAYEVVADPPVRMQRKSYSDNFRWGRPDNWTH